MKARFYVGLLVVGVLTAFNAVGATAAQSRAESAANATAKPAPTEQKKPAKKPARIASKSKTSREIAKKRLPTPKLDLSLPPEMVKQLQPLGTVAMPKHKPLLPNLFDQRPIEDSPFQLNGRLISNEMELQLRNEARDRQIEGAALDFEFKQ